ncbi:MAG: hypothetical protein LKH93_06975 [Clostridium beijerinckii]|jgi:hypothetical protein|nr:hypothetical protein [Clostridium beijerinckii]MCI1578567.1 hypothetical protein [Clostridium beijerinckii]MCI1582101.1 hypothetical protein [Clostridium beijerinckii]MCI1621951.1 hypothetical protein [Clostridium beijerinckii]
MKNLLNIDDKVKVVLQGEGKENVIGNGEIVTICTIQKISGEIYYTGEYHQNCTDGGEGYDTGIQFKEGEYERLDSNVSTELIENAAKDKVTEIMENLVRDNKHKPI